MKMTYKAVCASLFSILVLQNGFQKTVAFADNENGWGDEWSLFYSFTTSTVAFTGLKQTLRDRYTSLDTAELAAIEYEVGAFTAVGAYALAQDFGSTEGYTLSITPNSTSYTGLCYYYSGQNAELGTGTVVCNGRQLSFSCDGGSFNLVQFSGPDFGVDVGAAGSGNYQFVYSEVRLYKQTPTNITGLSSSGVFDWHNGTFVYDDNWSDRTFSLGGYKYNPETVIVGSGYQPRFVWDSNYTSLWQDTAPGYVLFMCCDPISYQNITSPSDIIDQTRDYVAAHYPNYEWVEIEEPAPPVDPLEINQLELPPDLPNADFHDIELPSETFPTHLTDGAGFWFSSFSDLVTALGLKPYIILFLALALTLVILKI